LYPETCGPTQLVQGQTTINRYKTREIKNTMNNSTPSQSTAHNSDNHTNPNTLYGLKANDHVQIVCCSGKSCRTKHDSEKIIESFKMMLHAHGIDDMVDVVTAGCLGFCAKGPIVRILPENVTYTQVKLEDVNVIVEKHVVRGELVTELSYAEVTAHHIEVESQHWSSFRQPVSLDSMLHNYIYEIGGKRFLNVLSYVIDADKCRGCTACKRGCPVNAIMGTVKQPHVINPYKCTVCGKCKTRCRFGAIDGPIGVLDERNSVNDVLADIHDSDKLVVAQTAPAVRYALGEEFGMEPGTVVTGKMITALRMLGFDYVFDTDFGADFTIMEEAAELIDRLERFIAGDKDVKLPMTTSCCPAWVNFFENDYPDLRQYPSTCKSPAQMFGTIAKSYWSESIEIPRENISVISVMPCLAKKYECARDEFIYDGVPDVDCSITTRELAEMIRSAGIDFASLEDGEFDQPLGDATGAASIFGTTGGVTEAVLRTVYEKFTGKQLPTIEFTAVRGLDGIREASIDLNGFELKICVAHTLSNARILMDRLRAGELQYHFIEVMSCPGGCIGGTGQPYHEGDIGVLEARQRAMYNDDTRHRVRKSHESPAVQRVYDEFLGLPGSKRAHKLLHTRFRDKSIL